jgi:hypothetical protein
MNSKHIKKIIDKQFKLADLNLRYEDICKNQIPNWFSKYSYSEEINKKWKNWVMVYMRNKMKLTKDRAFIETEWVNLTYGLKIKNKKKNKK